MTTETNNTYERDTISGTGPYAFSWRIFDEDEITATALAPAGVDPSMLVIDTHYTVTGVNDEDGGSITLTAAAVTLYTGYTLDIRSNTIVQQPTSIKNQGTFAPSVHEKALDRLSRQIQDLARKVRSAFRYPDDTALDAVMTTRTSWLERYLYVNASGIIEPAIALANTLTQSIFNAFYALTDDHKRTAAEIAAGVTPVNSYSPPSSALSSAARYGIDFTGGADSTSQLQNWVNSCEGWMIFPPNGTIKVSGQITLPTSGVIMIGNNCTINAPTTGYHVLKCQGGLNLFQQLNGTRDAIAQNSSWKFINFDGGGYAIQAGSRLIERDCKILNFDIPIYADGSSSQYIDYVEVSGCNHVINTLGTGGAASVRPTVNLNNCGVVVVRDNPNLDASDATNAVNNIYCIGSAVVIVHNNTIKNGVLVKVLSSNGRTVERVSVCGNQEINGINSLICNADTNPIRHIVYRDNECTGQAPSAGDVGSVIVANTLGAVAGDAIGSFVSDGNRFRSIGRSVYYYNLQAGATIGSIKHSNNDYNDTSTAGAGTYAVVNQTGVGTFRNFQAINETVDGNANTRSYFQNAFTATNIQTFNIQENNLNGGAAGNGLVRIPRRRIVQAYSASMVIDASLGNFFTIDDNNGTAFTINAPTNPIDGQRITIKLKNSSGGALGAATWNAVFKMSAWTNPANGQNRSIDFEYDGTNWVQVSQTGVDVPN